MTNASTMHDGTRYPVVPGATHEQVVTVAGPGGAPAVEERNRCSCPVGHDHTDHDEWD